MGNIYNISRYGPKSPHPSQSSVVEAWTSRKVFCQPCSHGNCALASVGGRVHDGPEFRHPNEHMIKLPIRHRLKGGSTICITPRKASSGCHLVLEVFTIVVVVYIKSRKQGRIKVPWECILEALCRFRVDIDNLECFCWTEGHNDLAAHCSAVRCCFSVKLHVQAKWDSHEKSNEKLYRKFVIGHSQNRHITSMKNLWFLSHFVDKGEPVSSIASKSLVTNVEALM